MEILKTIQAIISPFDQESQPASHLTGTIQIKTNRRKYIFVIENGNP